MQAKECLAAAQQLAAKAGSLAEAEERGLNFAELASAIEARPRAASAAAASSGATSAGATSADDTSAVAASSSHVRRRHVSWRHVRT